MAQNPSSQTTSQKADCADFANETLNYERKEKEGSFEARQEEILHNLLLDIRTSTLQYYESISDTSQSKSPFSNKQTSSSSSYHQHNAQYLMMNVHYVVL